MNPQHFATLIIGAFIGVTISAIGNRIFLFPKLHKEPCRGLMVADAKLEQVCETLNRLASELESQQRSMTALQRDIAVLATKMETLVKAVDRLLEHSRSFQVLS